jgi:hypothetical protein
MHNKILEAKSERKSPLEKRMHRCDENIQMYHNACVDWNKLAQDGSE